MTDQERVLALIEEGKITQEEGDRLLSALGDIEAVEHETENLESSVRDQASSPADEPIPEKNESNPTSAYRAAAQQVRNKVAQEVKRSVSNKAVTEVEVPSDLNWVRVNLLAGDIDIHVDRGLAEPVVNGKAEVVKDGHDFIIKAGARNGDDTSSEGFGGFVARLVNKFGDLDIRIPEGYGVDISSKAGDVEVRDVPYLKGSLLAGDIDAHNIGGVALSLSAGDVDISLRPTRGEHRISATAGDVDIKLLEGSSVQIEGAVTMGDFQAKGFAVKTKESMTGGSFSGCVGEGAATLNIQLSAGDLDVKASE